MRRLRRVATDLGDLKAAHEALFKIVDARNLDGLLAMLHPDSASFLPSNPFPSRKPTAEVLKLAWSSVERVSNTLIDTQYVVVGDTGIAWGHVRRVRKLKDGPEEVENFRSSFTYVKSGGKWLLLSSHGSAIPSGE